MKIIKEGKIKSDVESQVTCVNCGGVYLVSQKDEVYLGEYRDYQDVKILYKYGIKCPTEGCGWEIVFRVVDRAPYQGKYSW